MGLSGQMNTLFGPSTWLEHDNHHELRYWVNMNSSPPKKNQVCPEYKCPPNTTRQTSARLSKILANLFLEHSTNNLCMLMIYEHNKNSPKSEAETSIYAVLKGVFLLCTSKPFGVPVSLCPPAPTYVSSVLVLWHSSVEAQLRKFQQGRKVKLDATEIALIQSVTPRSVTSVLELPTNECYNWTVNPGSIGHDFLHLRRT